MNAWKEAVETARFFADFSLDDTSELGAIQKGYLKDRLLEAGVAESRLEWTAESLIRIARSCR